MGFLSAVLPGVREFRTPFVIGALWVTAFALWAWKHYDGDFAGIELVANLRDMATVLPEPVSLGALAFTVYLVGVFARGFQDWLTNRSLFIRASSGMARLVPNQLSNLGHFSELTSNDYLRDAARERFANYPSAVRDTARRILNEEYDLADVILTSKSPEQYQEYDRWRSEAEFRNGIWVPLFLVGLGLAFLADERGAWLIGIGAGLVSIMLKMQGADRRRRADQRLASAVYFDLASTPLFDALLSEMNRRAEERVAWKDGKSVSDEERTAWAVEFFVSRGIDRLVLNLITQSPKAETARGGVQCGLRAHFQIPHTLRPPPRPACARI